jgi:hypothetical protein
MVVVPLSRNAGNSRVRPDASECETLNWVGFAAGGTLVAAGLLLLTGQRRAGMVTAASGAALAMLDQKETLLSWWNTLPAYIDEVQGLLTQVQGAVEELAAQRERLRRILAR